MGYWQGGGIFELSFSGGQLTINTIPAAHPMSMYIEDAGICDTAGQPLFYSNGIYIANANHDTMLNGSHLNPGVIADTWMDWGMPNSQGALVLPDPASGSLYYLFHFHSDPGNLVADTLLFTQVDMTLDGGLGGVTQKNIPFFADSIDPGELIATRHANGRDWWLIAHQNNSDLYYKFLVSPAGISSAYLQHIGNVKYYPGQACFSPDGSKYASYDNTNEVEVFDFDRCSGMFSNHQHIVIPDSAVSSGCCISPNSKVLYVSSNQFLYQLDLTAANVAGTLDTIATWDGFTDPVATTFAFQQLADDGKIYIQPWGGAQHLHVVNYPDSLGPACDVQQHAITLPYPNNGSMPNLPFYSLGALVGSACDTILSIGNEANQSGSQLNIFPNPCYGRTKISFQDWPEGQSLAEVYDMMGKELLSFELNFPGREIDLTGFPPGIFLLKVYSGNNSRSACVIRY